MLAKRGRGRGVWVWALVMLAVVAELVGCQVSKSGCSEAETAAPTELGAAIR